MRKETYLTVQGYRPGEDIAGAIMRTIAIIASVYGLCRNFHGPMSLTYFTDLSNIFIDVVLLVFLFRNFRRLRKGGKAAPMPNSWYVVKFMATISITLTFFIYLTLLAPTNDAGFLNAYFCNGAGSFCVHFVTPILAIADYILFDYRYVSNRLHVLFAIVPPYCYVGFVVILSHFGIRWNDTMYAPYNFLNYGAPTGWFGFDPSLLGSTTLGIGVVYMVVVLTILFVGVGALYLQIKNVRRRRRLGVCS